MIKKLRSKKGFTLIELLVVIAILGILVLLAAPKFLGYTKDAHVATMRADAKILANAALIHNIDNADKVDEADWPVAKEEDQVKYEIKIGEDEDAITISAVQLGKEEFKDSVKNLKNNYEDYVLVTEEDSEYQGEVFHIKGVADKKGDLHYGIDDTVEVEKIELTTTTP